MLELFWSVMDNQISVGFALSIWLIAKFVWFCAKQPITHEERVEGELWRASRAAQETARNTRR